MTEPGLSVEDLPLVRALPENGRNLVLERCTQRSFEPREVVFSEGEPGDRLYAVLSGRAVVQATTPSGESATYSLVGPGQTFGELALIDGRHRRTGTVIALEPLRTLMLAREDFLVLRDTYPAVDRLLVDVLSRAVERLSRHLLESLFLPVEPRIVRRLVAASGLYGGLEPGVVIPLTQEDLAALAGTTRPTVNQVLRKLEEEGAVTLHRGRMEIVSPELLRERARRSE